MQSMHLRISHVNKVAQLARAHAWLPLTTAVRALLRSLFAATATGLAASAQEAAVQPTTAQATAAQPTSNKKQRNADVATQLAALAQKPDEEAVVVFNQLFGPDARLQDHEYDQGNRKSAKQLLRRVVKYLQDNAPTRNHVVPDQVVASVEQWTVVLYTHLLENVCKDNKIDVRENASRKALVKALLRPQPIAGIARTHAKLMVCFLLCSQHHRLQTPPRPPEVSSETQPQPLPAQTKPC